MTKDLAATVFAYANELWNEHDLGAIDRYSSPDGVWHDFPAARHSEHFSAEELRRRVQRILAEMPDHQIEVLKTVSDSSRVFWGWRITGNWTLPNATTRAIDMHGSSIYTFSNGLISRRTGDGDLLGLDYQLGRVARRIDIVVPL